MQVHDRLVERIGRTEIHKKGAKYPIDNYNTNNVQYTLHYFLAYDILLS